VAAQLPVVTLDYSRRASLGLLWKLTRLQWRETAKNVIFLVLVLGGLLFMGTTAQAVGRMFGTVTWPVTYQVLETVGGAFQIFIIAIVTFYSGELVWRERDAKLSQIYDALPTPRWLIFTSKWSALVAVQALLLVIVLVSGLLLQTLKSYHHYELDLYVRWLFAIRLVDLAFLSTVALFVHVLVNHKYAGHFVMVGYYALAILLLQLGLEHKMYRLGSQPAWTYSDMNGFGPFVAPLVGFKLYWGSLAIVMAIASSVFWQRGVETGLRHRVKLARQRLSRVAIIAGLWDSPPSQSPALISITTSISFIDTVPPSSRRRPPPDTRKSTSSSGTADRNRASLRQACVRIYIRKRAA